MSVCKPLAGGGDDDDDVVILLSPSLPPPHSSSGRGGAKRKGPELRKPVAAAPVAAPAPAAPAAAAAPPAAAPPAAAPLTDHRSRSAGGRRLRLGRRAPRVTIQASGEAGGGGKKGARRDHAVPAAPRRPDRRAPRVRARVTVQETRGVDGGRDCWIVHARRRTEFNSINEGSICC